MHSAYMKEIIIFDTQSFSSEYDTKKAAQRLSGIIVFCLEFRCNLQAGAFNKGHRQGLVKHIPMQVLEHSKFVCDLAPDVTDNLLQETFKTQYPSVRGAKTVTDPNTGRSKGYGFVKFADEMERNRAMSEMNGMYCSRPMRN
ncbi:hypothetical protein CTI12_AA195440 [Artemisia annua]|uniref:RRM domain-containing protein n=1 Tax=Artemisia annua TaxID=35608 RepID=A0A2U1P461_ARTAN|nr:hypothetical protein CTI12_AA195440 [Artemisia annua]